jgi:hypothetical protein
VNILVFPSCLEGSLSFLQEARRHGQRVVGASSLKLDPYADRFDAWERLPFLQDPDFSNSLAALLIQWAVEKVFTPHAPTYHFLSQRQELLPEGVTLMGPSPYEQQSGLVRSALEGMDQRMRRISAYAGKAIDYPSVFVASLLHYARGMYGECREEKALALCGAMADAPTGDVIEIGAFFGKSAFLLNRLAASQGIGATLVVDSWEMQASVQAESPAEIRSLSGVWDWQVVFNGFLLTTGALTAGSHFNYLRLSSAEAWTVYDSGAPIRSPEFGQTPMVGHIALLHIDGNHDESHVRQDFTLWSQRLADGGWVVFDDYTWSHGDGPRRVADKVLTSYGNRVSRHFVSGGALFLKFAGKA